MMLFACAGEEGAVTPRLKGGPIRLWRRLDAAERDCTQQILVVDAARADIESNTTEEMFQVEAVPREAILNDRPYRPPRAVTAAGGYVVRPAAPEPEVLVIFRRGVWDLPKGKLDQGESIPDCALREVREELGIGDLRIRRPLGTTLHGYPDGAVYSVKTTYWYLMETREEQFAPQSEEQIEKVEWLPWNEAKQRVGFETLREHMRLVEGDMCRGL
jgi:8-oxo-(d)GTP phosphatase